MITFSAKQHLSYFDKFVRELKSKTNAKLSSIDLIIGKFLMNGHVDHAIKYTKEIYDDLKKSKSAELSMSGLIANLVYFLCTNTITRPEKKKILLQFMKKLPLRQYGV